MASSAMIPQGRWEKSSKMLLGDKLKVSAALQAGQRNPDSNCLGHCGIGVTLWLLLGTSKLTLCNLTVLGKMVRVPGDRADGHR